VIGAVESVIEPLQPQPVVPPRRGAIDGLLAEPGEMVQRALSAEAATQAALVRSLLVAIVAGTAAFGAAVGLYRGGIQVLFAAIKLPCVVLMTAVVSTPALTALALALGRATDLRTDLIRVLAALARGSLVLAALAPVMLLSSSVRLDYHQAVLLCVTCCALAGMAGLPLLGRLLWAERRGRLFLLTAMLAVVGLAGTHSAWLFRPYLVRPRTTSVPFMRGLDGDFADAVGRSGRSAVGIYDQARCAPRSAQETP
jgi:hypothetical protein